MWVGLVLAFCLAVICQVSAEHFTITVHTADRAHAGTNAQPSIVLYSGPDDDDQSQVIALQGGDLERGGTDVFEVDADNVISPISSIDLSHDNSGKGPGWFVSNVEVFSPSTGIDQTFPVNGWVGTESKPGDRIVEDESSRNTVVVVATTPGAQETTIDYNKIPKEGMCHDEEGYYYWQELQRRGEDSNDVCTCVEGACDWAPAPYIGCWDEDGYINPNNTSQENVGCYCQPEATTFEECDWMYFCTDAWENFQEGDDNVFNEQGFPKCVNEEGFVFRIEGKIYK